MNECTLWGDKIMVFTEENLADAGCEPQLIEKLLLVQSEGQRYELTTLLKEHRRSLLDSIHGRQKELDILDYLMFQYEREQKE